MFISWCQQPFIYQSVGWLQLELKYLRFIIMQHTFPIFFKLILYMYLCYHIEFEQQKCEVCECVRVSGALHSSYTVTVNYLWTQNPFRECVWFNVENMSRLIVYTRSPLPHIYTQQYTVCKYVCWSHNRIAWSSWYLHLKVNLNQFLYPVDGCLNDFWLIGQVSALFNIMSGAWI